MFTVNNKEYALHVDNNTVTALEVGYESRLLPYISLLGIRDEQKYWSTEKQAHENDRNPSLLVADHKAEFSGILYSCALRYDICQKTKAFFRLAFGHDLYVQDFMSNWQLDIGPEF